MRLSFEAFDVDLESGQLLVAGRPVALERRAFEMLCYLAQHPGRLISKDELLSEVWSARSLSDGVVMNAAAKLRKALGQAPSATEPIETIRGRGYRLQAVPRRLAAAATQRAESTLADPFVGREQVLRALDDILDRALRSQGQLVLLSGEAGIGKTRTLEELGKRARERGFSVWEGAAYDGAGAPAYWPWVEILRAAYADLSRAMFRRHVPDDSPALALLVPELLDARNTLEGDAQLEATRFRLFDELSRFLSSASAVAPRVIIADDAHWADAGTLELFTYAARALKKRPIVLALALREDGVADDSLQAARTDVLARLGRAATHIVLPGLAAAAVAQLVAALAPRALNDAKLLTQLHERTQGNPFFVRQLLTLLTQSAGAEETSLETLETPKVVRDLLQQRIAALPAATQTALQLAATIGTEFELSVLASALEQSPGAVLNVLNPALERALIEQTSSEQQRFAFGHVLLRDALHDALSPAQRGAQHARRRACWNNARRVQIGACSVRLRASICWRCQRSWRRAFCTVNGPRTPRALR